MNYAKYIVRDKAICGGQPVIAGTRVPLRTVLASLAEGDRIEGILAGFPTLTEEAVRAVIAFLPQPQPKKTSLFPLCLRWHEDQTGRESAPYARR